MLEASHLGKKTEYANIYNPKLLFSIPRQINRLNLGIDDKNPGFYGVDIWNHYEISWLNQSGKPYVALGEIKYSASSKNIIESKSMKLYFNSLNNTKFTNEDEFIKIVTKDLSEAAEAPVDFILLPAEFDISFAKPKGYCLDKLDVNCDIYQPNPDYLSYSTNVLTEELYSYLLKSNCPVTNQPDWGSIFINYTGPQINKNGLLKYIISLREHNEFHEQCVERVFRDIMQYCKPSELTVYARYTRRGGIDINPYRTTNKNFTVPNNIRLIRQ